jgi:hypothetical protein
MSDNKEMVNDMNAVIKSNKNEKPTSFGIKGDGIQPIIIPQVTKPADIVTLPQVSIDKIVPQVEPIKQKLYVTDDIKDINQQPNFKYAKSEVRSSSQWLSIMGGIAIIGIILGISVAN